MKVWNGIEKRQSFLEKKMKKNDSYGNELYCAYCNYQVFGKECSECEGLRRVKLLCANAENEYLRLEGKK